MTNVTLGEIAALIIVSLPIIIFIVVEKFKKKQGPK